MSKYKILFILHIPPPVHGSSVVGKYIKNSSVINQNFECRYINLGTSSSIDELGKYGLSKLWRYISILWQVFIQIIRFKPDLCYFAITAKGPAFYKDALAAMLIKSLRIKLVYHFHNKGISTNQQKWFDNFLYKKVLKKSDVILLSKYLYHDIQKYVREERVYYCPNGIPDHFKKPNLAIKKGGAVQILFLSNLIESKGVYILLAACKLLHGKQLPFHCTFVGGEGDVTSEQFQKKVEEYGLHDIVHYAGHKYGEDKEEAFTQADIFTLPTYYHFEAFPLVTLEAMQFSLPVVSTFEGGIPDIVEDGKTGFLIPVKDVAALDDKLERLIQYSTLRQQMGAAGRVKYEREFTLITFELRLNEILTKICTSATKEEKT